MSVPRGQLARWRWTLLIAVLCLAVVSVLAIALASEADPWMRKAVTQLSQAVPRRHLQIDRFFVAGMDRGPEESAYARAIIKLGHSLGLDVVAEGVETPGELEELRRAGCDFAQGYLFARPAPAADIEHMLAADVDELARL